VREIKLSFTARYNIT